MIISTFLAIILSATTTKATPIDDTHSLVPRENKYNLKCSNAPGIVAGNICQPSDYVLSTSLPPSGSDQKWMKYLWCTAGSETYTFFDFGFVTNYPKGYFNFYYAFLQAEIFITDQIAQHGDGVIDKFIWTYPNTNVGIWATDSVGKMTWGILGAAINGLKLAVQNHDQANYPLVFQINDGKWGEVGVGAAGLLAHTPSGQTCTVEDNGQGNSTSCDDVLNFKAVQ